MITCGHLVEEFHRVHYVARAGGSETEEVINTLVTRFQLPDLNNCGYFNSIAPVYSAYQMKKLYSLAKNGREIVSVEMDVPDFMPSTVINREWLKGIITEEVSASPVKPPRRVRHVRPSKPKRQLARAV
jgi:hypothetical protein